MKLALRSLVGRSLKSKEILHFLCRDNLDYEWSLGALDSQLRHFKIYYVIYDTVTDSACETVPAEVDGPGKLVEYQALNKKIRIEHDIKVPSHLVYYTITKIYLEGLDQSSLT